MNLLKKVLKFATEAHGLQTRSDGKPYITHPIAVAKIAAKEYFNVYFNTSPETNEIEALILKIIALLHDAAEDVDQYKNNEDLIVSELKKLDTKEELREADWREICASLKRLNKNRYKSYKEYILGVNNYGYLDRFVKIADLKHNLSDLPPGTRRDKYELALAILTHE